MTAIPMEDHDTGTRAGFNVWRCCSCRCFHLQAGKVLLTFTPDEYAVFTQAIVECYHGGRMCRHSTNDAARSRGGALMLVSEAEN